MDVRRLRYGEEKDAIRLSDEVFRQSGQKSMGQAFPGIFSPQLIHHSYGGFVNGELVTFFGLVPSTIQVGPAALNTFSLGSVCTDPGYRGKGYAARVLIQLLNDLKESEASLLLISGDRSLYTRVGAQLFGEIQEYRVVESALSNLRGNQRIRDMAVTDLHQMYTLANQRSVAYGQTVQEMALLIHAEAYASCLNLYHKVKVLEENGKLKAFLIAGLPLDKEEIKIGRGVEWAGKAQHVHALAQAFIKNEGIDAVYMPIPWQDVDEQEIWHCYESTRLRNQGTLYLINPARFVEQVSSYYRAAQQVDFMKAQQQEGNIILEINDRSVSLTQDAFVSLFFDRYHEDSLGLGVQTLPFPYTAGLNYV